MTMGQIRSATQRACVESSAGTFPTLYSDLDVDDPTTRATVLWDYTGFPTGACVPFSFNMTVSRLGGPCGGSTIQLQDPPATPGASPYIYTWAGPCA